MGEVRGKREEESLGTTNQRSVQRLAGTPLWDEEKRCLGCDYCPHSNLVCRKQSSATSTRSGIDLPDFNQLWWAGVQASVHW